MEVKENITKEYAKDMIKYRQIVETAEEVEPAARKLISQVVDKDKLHTLIVETEEGKKYPSLVCIVYVDSMPDVNKSDYERETLPKVYVHELPSGYALYLLTDREKLPLYYRSLTNESVILPLYRPTIKPESELPVEALLTKEGQELIDSLDCEETVVESPEVERRLTLASPSLRLAALFDVYEKGISEAKYNKALKVALSELEKDTYEDGVADNEAAIALVTGKDTSTEKKYLAAVATYLGTPVPEKYKKELVHGYRFYKALRFRDWLYYELLRTEDYKHVETIAAEAAKKIGYKEEYLLEILGDLKPAEGLTVAKLALVKYLHGYLLYGKYFDGITDSRLASYLNVDKATFGEVVNNYKEYYYNIWV